MYAANVLWLSDFQSGARGPLEDPEGVLGGTRQVGRKSVAKQIK